MTPERIAIGSYTSQDGGGTGIGLGTLETMTTAVRTDDPSYLVLSADGRHLYAVNELDAGRVSAFALGDGLEFLGDQPTEGSAPCHLTLSPDGAWLLTANYASGSLSVHPIAADGSIGPATQVVRREGSGADPDRQEGPHAHQVGFDPSGRFVFDVDLGTDTVHTSTLADGRLTEVNRLQLPPGTGPRHLAFHPDGGAAYVISELDSTLTVCRHTEGLLESVQTVSTRPAGAVGDNFPAAVLVSADGRFVYGSNRGDDTIAVFAVADGGLGVTLLQTVEVGGSWPRHLAFGADGNRLYVAAERADRVVEFAVDRSGGGLTATETTLAWPKPVCVLPV